MKGKSLFFGRLGGYSLQGFRKDLVSGFIVGIIAIPLGMAFAIAAGVKPEYGIYTTIIAGILISVFGGSRFQIGGPTGAFIPILFGIVMTYGYENLLIAGFMAGIILILMGIFKLGSLIKFIPRPVTIGFTAGIAVIIFTGQIPNFLGMSEIDKHEYFHQNILEIFSNLNLIEVYSVLTAIVAFIAIFLTPKIAPKVPGSLVGLIVATAFATILFPDKVATIGSTFGAIPSGLPEFQMPEITFEKIKMLIIPAFVIAMLGGIESLLSAVVADGMTNSKHNSNKELVGQGIANVVTPMFGGIPATGAIARTATNIKNGAVSPISGVIHGFVVLLILLLFAPYASHIPLAAMAPILMVVAWNMSERKVFAHILKMRSEDSLILVVTFSLTVLVNLTVAVPVGLLLAIISFVKRMGETTVTERALPNRKNPLAKIEAQVYEEARDCPQIKIYNVEGPLFFGAAQSFEHSVMKMIDSNPRVLIFRMGKVPFMDTTGEQYFRSIVQQFNRNGVVLITGLNKQPKEIMRKTGLDVLIGKEHIFEHTGEAIDYALTQLDKNQCVGCQKDAFKECEDLSKGKDYERVNKEKRKETMVTS